MASQESESGVQAPDSSRPSWSPWGEWLIATLALGVALCFLWWWIGTSYLDLPLSTYVSWRPFDEPTQVPPHFPEAILNQHYFGDFQESRWWGLDILSHESPYGFINIYPPAATWVMVPFAALQLVPALLIYLTLTVAALTVPAWLLLRGVRAPQRILVVALVAVATAPFLTTIDRGNLQGLTIGLVGLSLAALQRSRVRWAAVLLALAICLKPFVVILLVVVLARRRRRFATNTFAISLVVTVVAWLALPGDWLTNFASILKSQFDATGGPDFTFVERIFASVGLHGLVANLDLVATTLAGRGIPLAHARGSAAVLACAWVALVFVVAWRRRVPQWAWGSLALASLQLVQPYAAMYTASWATLAAVWFGLGAVIPTRLAGQDNEPRDVWTKLLRVVVLAALTVTLLPLALWPQIAGATVPVQQILSPLLWLVVGLLALAASFVRPRHSDADLSGPSPTTTPIPL